MQRHNLTPRPNWQQHRRAAGPHLPHAGSARRPAHAPTGTSPPATSSPPPKSTRLEAAGNELQRCASPPRSTSSTTSATPSSKSPPKPSRSSSGHGTKSRPRSTAASTCSTTAARPPKLLEYNADTPTSLLEAAVIQWYWLKDIYPDADQFNSLHEKLIAKWKDVASYLSKPVYFASADYPEDLLTVAYLRDTAEQAGLPHPAAAHGRHRLERAAPVLRRHSTRTKPHPVHLQALPVGDDARRRLRHAGLRTYKDMRWIEPIWKLLLSNKGILPILWELYPNHDSCSKPTSSTPAQRLAARARLGAQAAALARRREHHPRRAATATSIETAGPYTNRLQIDQRLGPPVIFRRRAPNPATALRWPVLGLWMIDQECCGMGIREDAGPITGNLSSFVPHFFR